ncbi:MAG TPA: hypothetical protein PLD82_02390, partial [Spirochaetota bacterium]|nr:hypothetical protein [Spirochaetota bacterium]
RSVSLRAIPVAGAVSLRATSVAGAVSLPLRATPVPGAITLRATSVAGTVSLRALFLLYGSFNRTRRFRGWCGEISNQLGCLRES